MDRIIKLTEEIIESNIKEIVLLKAKQDNLISELADTHLRIKTAEIDNDALEMELVQYVKNIPNASKMANTCGEQFRDRIDR